MDGTPLIQAVANREYVKVYSLLESIAAVDLDKADNNGYSALHHAAKTGFCVSSLLKSDINLNLQDSAGNTPLMLASCEGLCAVVKSLCSAGADVNIYNDFNRTPCQTLLLKGHVECLEVLFQYGARLSSTRPHDLITALNYGRVGAVLYVLKLIPDYKEFFKGSDDLLIHTAVNLKDEEFIAALLQIGFVTVDDKLRQVEYDVHGDTTISRLLQVYCHCPLSLKQLCRLAIRACLTGPILPPKCTQLPLPKRLLQYVTISEVDLTSGKK